MILFMESYQLTLHYSQFIFSKAHDKRSIRAEKAYLNLHNHLSEMDLVERSNQQHLPHSHCKSSCYCNTIFPPLLPANNSFLLYANFKPVKDFQQEILSANHIATVLKSCQRKTDTCLLGSIKPCLDSQYSHEVTWPTKREPGIQGDGEMMTVFHAFQWQEPFGYKSQWIIWEGSWNIHRGSQETYCACEINTEVQLRPLNEMNVTR